MNGGPSQVDTFDPKPSLSKYNGKAIPLNLSTERKTGAAMASPFKFKQYGRSGIEVSDLFARVGGCIDDICVIRSMHADVPNHEPSLMLMNCGEARQARPSVGSWLLYGLGSENQNLPGFVVLCPGGMPISEAQNWQSAFLPGIYQGTYVDSQHTEIEKLIAHIKNGRIRHDAQRAQLDLLMQLNREHMERRQSEAQFEARIQSFELAFRMQSEAGDAFDVSKEPEETRELYGPGVQARQLLVARRFLERGVRYVQVYHGAGQPWDSHDDIESAHKELATQCDRPIAALLKDLKRLGMLEETLVIWGGEFGRTPTVELPTPGANAGKMNGRDHNHYGFTDVDGRRRREGRPRPRGHRRVRLPGRPGQGPRPRPPRDHPPPPRLRPRDLHLPLRRPRLPPHRRPRPRHQGHPRLNAPRAAGPPGCPRPAPRPMAGRR